MEQDGTSEHGAAEGLPVHVLAESILSHLTVQDLLACAGVSTAWRAAAQQDVPWRAARERDHPAANEATLAVLRARVLVQSGQREAERLQIKGQVDVGGREMVIYRWLAHTAACERCGQAFTDATNTPTSCCFHPGILFSGGQLNGTGLRFTCCNRRAHHVPNGSRDGNGCTSSFHAGGSSAWQRHGAGVKPREVMPEAAPSSGGTGSGGGSSGGSGSGAVGSPPRPYPWLNSGSREQQEWHPNQRPGILELPSRLLFSGSL